jgi:cytochrome c biogenesis factor
MRRLWETAMAGEMLGQLVYMLSIVPAMHAISHQTDWVIPVWIHMAIFLIPVLSLCRIRNSAVGLPTPLHRPPSRRQILEGVN